MVFSQIPSLYERPTITSEAPTYSTDDDGNVNMNHCIYTASVSESWREIMEKSGFALEISLYPQNSTILNWNFDDDEAEWDDGTLNGESKPTCTLHYLSDAVNNLVKPVKPVKPKLVAQIRIFLPEQGNLEATAKERIKEGREYWEATVSKNRDLLSSAYTKVAMTPELEANLQFTQEFALGWNPGPPMKGARTSQAMKLMSNMVTRQPLASATSNAINSNMKNAVKAEPHIIRSVNQVLELGTVITDLNKKTARPNLKPVVPVASL